MARPNRARKRTDKRYFEMSLPRELKLDDKVYFIPYTTDTPQIKLGHITEDFTGHRFIAYDYQWADDGEWYICKEEDTKKPETKIKIFNLLQKINAAEEEEEERKQIKEVLK